MKIIKFTAAGILILLTLAVLVVLREHLLPPPMDVSELHVVKIAQVDLQGCSVGVSTAPDDEHYVCSKGGPDSGMWLGSFRKGLEKRLTDAGGDARWLPHGREIVYAEIVPHQPTMLYQLDIENGNRIPISTTTMPYGGDHLQVLPDGRVLFLEKGALQVWDSHTRTLKSFETLGCIDPQMTPTATVYSFYTTVSPDGEHLADLCAGTIFLKDVTIGRVITLATEVEFGTRQMAWSPDGRQLAYSFTPKNIRMPELWLVNADGTNPRRLWRGYLKERDRPRAFDDLTWMPDGQTLLFINNPGGTSLEDGSLTYMAISVKGGLPKELFTNGEGLALFDKGRKILILRSGMMSNSPRGNFVVELSQ